MSRIADGAIGAICEVKEWRIRKREQSEGVQTEDTDL